MFYLGFVLLLRASVAQENKQIYIDGRLSTQKAFTDTLQQKRWLQDRLWDYWSSGFLFADVDSIINENIYLHLGTQYDADEQRVYVYDSDSAQYRSLPSKRPYLQARSYANKGYPFATLQLDSTRLSGKQYEAHYTLDTGPMIRFDSIALLSGVRVNRSYLENTFDIRAGEPFSEKAFSQISQKMSRISFLSLKQPPDIAFEDGRSIIYLDLNQESSSSFEGVIGFLPNQGASGGLAFTGYLDLALSNLFQSGIDFDLNWNRFANQSQQLNLNYLHPYLLSSGLFLDLDFGLLKQDTTYLTRSWKLGIGAPLWNTLSVQVAYENAGGSMISADLSDFRNGFADYQTNYYSLQLGHIRFASPFGYQSGMRFFTTFAIGDKSISTNRSLGIEAYDSLQLNSLITSLSGKLKYQVLLLKRAAIFHEVRGVGIFNNQIINNEISRVGGLRSMRGFNENFFFAQHYLLSRFEFRQYFEDRSFFMVFYDQLFYAFNTKWDQPYGIGGGLNLNTSNGLFTFALAAGAARSIPLDLANMKVHFGYTTTF